MNRRCIKSIYSRCSSPFFKKTFRRRGDDRHYSAFFKYGVFSAPFSFPKKSFQGMAAYITEGAFPEEGKNLHNDRQNNLSFRNGYYALS